MLGNKQSARLSSAEASSVDAPIAANQTFWQRYKTHIKKWWWLHFLVFAAVVLVVALPLIYVGAPRIAQDELNRSKLTVNKMSVTNPTRESVDLDIDATAESFSIYHPTLDAFNASLYLDEGDETPFGYLQISPITVSEKIPVKIAQTLHIADEQRFIAYNKAVLTSTEFSYSISGRTVVHQTGLPGYGSDYNKRITSKGFNNFEGFELQNPNITLQPDEAGYNFYATARIPNPSDITLDLGNIAFNLSVEGTYIGQALIDNLSLAPGDNYAETRATANTTTIIGHLPSDFQLQVEITGDTIRNKNNETLTFYQEAMKGLTLHSTIDLTKLLGGSG